MSAAFRVEKLQVHLSNKPEPLLGPLSFECAESECLGLVGESGSGKSLTALSLLGLLPPGLRATGGLQLFGEDIVFNSTKHLALLGREIAWMPQDASAALHPLRTVGDQLGEAIRVLQKISASQAKNAALALFRQLELPEPELLQQRYPHQLSGGQRQRVLLAIALAGKPKILIADEPTSALDPRLAREALELLDALRQKLQLAILLISHDLPLLGNYAQRVMVLQRGKVVESGSVEQIFLNAKHAYTQELLAAEHLPAPAPHAIGESILTVDQLSIRYPRAKNNAVEQAQFDLKRGECLVVLGESGSGKSSLGRACLRLIQHGVSGSVKLDGEELLQASRQRLRLLRRRMGVVFQDPAASLNPRSKIVDIVGEPLRIQTDMSVEQRRIRVIELLQQVGMDASALERYRHQFSGGQQQRIAIARALAMSPDILICDEAVSALDAHHRAGIIRLLSDIVQTRGLALVFITHDMACAKALADQVLVMDQGRVLEQGSARNIWQHAQHPVTRSLLAARPSAISTF
ncbi:MAG: dipeptide ABC transporter ATP-binding protein [Arenimonas sp.]